MLIFILVNYIWLVRIITTILNLLLVYDNGNVWNYWIIRLKIHKFQSSQHEAVANFTSWNFVRSRSELIVFFIKIYIKFHELQALNFHVKNLKCFVDSEYAEVKACYFKSLEHDSYNIDMNIVFIKEVTKLQVKSNWTCYC